MLKSKSKVLGHQIFCSLMILLLYKFSFQKLVGYEWPGLWNFGGNFAVSVLIACDYQIIENI